MILVDQAFWFSAFPVVIRFMLFAQSGRTRKNCFLLRFTIPHGILISGKKTTGDEGGEYNVQEISLMFFL